MEEYMPLNVVDLFCGCGGFSCGFYKKDFNIFFATDYSDIAIESYKCNFPQVNAVSMDIADVHKEFILRNTNSTEIDIVIGGPPCSELTLSKMGCFICSESENKLFFHFSRIVNELSPRIFVIENIEKVTTLYDGKLKEEIILHFKKMGYITTNYVLCSELFGIPQFKKRSIFIGIKKCYYSGDINFDRFHTHMVSAYDALSDLPSLIEENASNRYVSEPKNEYQKRMRYKSKKLSEHFLLSSSDALILNRTIKERKISASFPAPNIDTRKKYRDQMHYYENRLLSIRELARLQSFTDTFIFFGVNEEKINQIGNAIPPLLASVISSAIIEYFFNSTKRNV